MLEIVSGDYRFVARLEEELGARRRWPHSGGCCRSRAEIIHARWSGESCWIPFGELERRLRARERHVLPGARTAALAIRAGSARRRSCSRTARPRSRARPGCSRATTLRRCWKASSSWASLAARSLWGESAQPLRRRRAEPPETAPHPISGWGEGSSTRHPLRAYRGKARVSVTDACRNWVYSSTADASRSSAPVSTSTASSTSSSAECSSGEWLIPPFRLRTKSIATGTPAAARTPAS